MKATINHHILTQTDLDSGSLTMLGAVVHNFPEAGEYLGNVLRNEKTVAGFQLSVNEASPAMQVNIDLSKLEAEPAAKGCCEPCGRKTDLPRFEVNPKGYAVFHLSSGAGGYRVQVGSSDPASKKVYFDSGKLYPQDYFTATLLRPGTYSLTNTLTRAEGKIVVDYPRTGKTAYRPPEPIQIKCGEKGFEPDLITIEPARGQVYRFEVPSRIKIELREPDDGPNGPCESRGRLLRKRKK